MTYIEGLDGSVEDTIMKMLGGRGLRFSQPRSDLTSRIKKITCDSDGTTATITIKLSCESLTGELNRYMGDEIIQRLQSYFSFRDTNSEHEMRKDVVGYDEVKHYPPPDPINTSHTDLPEWVENVPIHRHTQQTTLTLTIPEKQLAQSLVAHTTPPTPEERKRFLEGQKFMEKLRDTEVMERNIRKSLRGSIKMHSEGRGK